MSDSHAHCHASDASAPIAVGKKLRIVATLFVVVLALSFLDVLQPLNQSLLEYLSVIWLAVLLGLLIGGAIDYFVPDGFMVRFLGRKRKSTLINAVVAGFLMSACSHGILAIAIQLYKKGASVPAVITFLLASPWANLPMTLLLFGFFGWQAAWIVFGAMGIALSTGYIFTLLDRAGLIEDSNPTVQGDHVEWTRLKNPVAGDAVRGVVRGSMSLANMVLWWILLGVMFAALIGAYVPEHIFHDYLGPHLSGLLLTLLFATVIEVCSEGSSPVAFEIFNQTGVLGNPFVFLMAGVATDYTEIGLLWTNIGRKTAIWLPVVTVPQVLLVAMMFNWWL